MKDFVLQNLTLCYNRTEQKWTSLTVHLDEVSSAELCPAFICLACGQLIQLVKSGSCGYIESGSSDGAQTEIRLHDRQTAEREARTTLLPSSRLCCRAFG